MGSGVGVGEDVTFGGGIAVIMEFGITTPLHELKNMIVSSAKHL
jgi:hypothetical protein